MIRGYVIAQYVDTLSDPATKIACLVAPNQRKFVSLEDQNNHKKWANSTINHLKGERIDAIYSDGNRLDVLFYAGKDAITKSPIEKNQRTIIFLGGMGYNHYSSYTLTERFREKGCNIIQFQYRGVGQSEGELKTQSDIIKDGQSIIDYLVNTHLVPQENIVVYGFSMGGALAPSIAATRAKVSIISDRSMSSIAIGVDGLSHAVRGKMWEIGIGHGSNIHYDKWPLHPAKDWNQITGRKCVVYHIKDLFLPHMQLSYSLMAQSDTSTKFIELVGGEDHPLSPHARPYTDTEFNQIFDSIFPEPSNVEIRLHQTSQPTSFNFFIDKYNQLKKKNPMSLGTCLLATYIGIAPETVLWQLLFLASKEKLPDGRIIGNEYYSFEHLKNEDFATLYKILHDHSKLYNLSEDLISPEYGIIHNYLVQLSITDPDKYSGIVKVLKTFPHLHAVTNELLPPTSSS